jgi:hypothetical protein
MRRREFTKLAAATVLWPTVASAQKAMPVIGYLGTGSLESDAFRVTAFRQGLGPFMPVANARGLGPAFAAYEDKFLQYAAQLAPAEATDYEWYYYDRARVFYAYYARSGDKAFLDRAHRVLLAYRTKCVEPNYDTPSYWTFTAGLGVHYLLTGDLASQKAIGRLGDNHAMPYYMQALGDKLIPEVNPDGLDPRTHARMLEGFMWAKRIGAPSPVRPTYDPTGKVFWGDVGGNNWADLIPQVVEGMLASQKPDGRYGRSENQQYSPFMFGIQNSALIEYYENEKKDPRIPDAIKRNLDFMWAKAWVPDHKAFLYNIADPTEEGGAAPDLNMLIVEAFGWLAKVTGDRSYIQKGDLIFQGGIEGGTFDMNKQFNQQYCTGYRYLGWRQPS